MDLFFIAELDKYKLYLFYLLLSLISDQTADKPRRRRNSSKTRKRTLSGRSISDHSDSELDLSAVKSVLEQTDTPNTPNSKQTVEPMEVVESNHVTNNGSVPPMEVYSNCDNTSVELKTEIFNFVQEKLFSRLVLTLSELKKLFTLKLAICPPGHVLGSGVSDKLLEETVIEVGGIRLKNQVSHFKHHRLFCSVLALHLRMLQKL